MPNNSNLTAQMTIIKINLDVPDSADIHDDIEQVQRQAYLSASLLVESTLKRVQSFCKYLGLFDI